ncbi:MAG: XRE family transcriptional regulator [Helicobacteraceae bacterium]|nr:XRE family transcriptional regulator [Candidatus Sulfurimonas ponti]MBL6972968.1 XRE family transcriptional regulator [Sulfurimonas sp.]
MAINLNKHVFKGHKTLLGSKYVTYGELELPLREDLCSRANNFDWGHNGPASMQLSFAILCQISGKEIAKTHMVKFTQEVVKQLNSRDWILDAGDVIEWINVNEEKPEESKSELTLVTKQASKAKNTPKAKTKKSNVVKDICKELEITQKQLAEILEVPEGTVSSWAVKNEIPRLGKKAIEFYTQSHKNQKIVDSYKDFMHLLHAS